MIRVSSPGYLSRFTAGKEYICIVNANMRAEDIRAVPYSRLSDRDLDLFHL